MSLFYCLGFHSVMVKLTNARGAVVLRTIVGGLLMKCSHARERSPPTAIDCPCVMSLPQHESSRSWSTHHGPQLVPLSHGEGTNS